MNGKLKIGALCSGRGSNLLAILEKIKDKTLDAEIKLVISDRFNAEVIKRAQKESLKVICLPRKEYKNQEDFEKEIELNFKKEEVELVILAGFERLVGKTLLKAFPNKIINIHPSLLPAFPGLGVWQEQINYGVKIAGCTVHFVDEGLDSGPIIMQAAVPVLTNDSAETLAERILKQEHIIYAKAIQLYAKKQIIFNGRQVKIKDENTNKEQSVISGY